MLAPLAIALVAIDVVAAQPAATSEARDLRNAGGDVWHAWTSPGRFDRRDRIVASAAVGTIAISVVADSIIWRWLSSHEDAIPLRLLAPVRSNGPALLKDLTTSTYLVPLSALAYAAGRLSHSGALRDAGLGCGASYLASLGFRLVSVSLVGRSRPYLGEGHLDLSFPGLRDWDRRSFTAGHAGNAAACASFLSHRFSFGYGEPVLYGYVAAVGIGRMADGWHWTSDTITGVLAGVALGAAVAERQGTRSDQALVARASRVTRIPLVEFRVTF